jgi:hypothetical protein
LNFSKEAREKEFRDEVFYFPKSTLITVFNYNGIDRNHPRVLPISENFAETEEKLHGELVYQSADTVAII